MEKLRQKYEEALTCPEIEGISIATRADCLPADVLALLAELNKKTNLWVELGGDCIAHLRADIVLHRLTGDGDKSTLLAPLWSLRKRDVLNHLHRYLRENHIRQGMSCKIDLSVIYNKPKDVL